MVVSKTKTFSGCWTCRNRKIKCDLKRPFCERCIKSNIQCEGYSIKLRWASTSGNSGDDEEYFQRRNVEFVEYPADMIYTNYDDMDADLNQLHASVLKENDTMMLGPFGVFNGQLPHGATNANTNTKQKQKPLARSHSEMGPDSSGGSSAGGGPGPGPGPDVTKSCSYGNGKYFMDNGLDQYNPTIVRNTMVEFSFEDHASQRGLPVTVAAMMSHKKGRSEALNDTNNDHTSPVDSLNSPASFAPALTNRSSSVDFPDNFDPALTNLSSSNASQPDDSLSVLASDSRLFHEVPVSSHDTDLQTSLMGTDLLKSVQPPYYVSAEVRLLLKHYMDNVVKIMAVVASEPNRNPWRRIYLPRAYIAIGDMCGTGRTTIARSALLNAILAVSAFHLQSKYSVDSEKRDYFSKKGTEFKSEAYRFMGKCLTIPVADQKYKDVITAILSMCTIDVMAGVMSDCRMHLIAAQTIINQRLVDRPRISKKAQVLHRIAGFLNIIQCSTIVNSPSIDAIKSEQNCESWFDLSLDDYVPEASEAPEAPEAPEASEVGVDVASPYGSTGSATAVSVTNFNERSQFHEYWKKYTNIIGSDSLPEDFYSKELVTTYALYGIPDSLILLFSRTTLISRQSLFYRTRGIPVDSKFSQSCIDLETALIRWQNRYDMDRNNPFTGDWNYAMNLNTLAFYQSLIIYYFRMTRNINPEVIQDLVSSVLKYLEDMQTLNRKYHDPIVVPNLFAGFIAACEVVPQHGPQIKVRFRKWFDQMSADGLGSYYQARFIVDEVWKRRDNGAPNSEWWKVIEEKDVNIMLS